jgi:hypothetical protein
MVGSISTGIQRQFAGPSSAESANGLTAQHVLKLYQELQAGDAGGDCQILKGSAPA